MLKVEIKTSYSQEDFIIPDWRPDFHTNYYGHKFADVNAYADFYLCGELCFCDDFDLIEVRAATQEEITEYVRRKELDHEELTARTSWPDLNL